MFGHPMNAEKEKDIQTQTLEELMKKMGEMDGNKFSNGSGLTITITPSESDQEEGNGNGMEEMGEMDGMDPRLMEIIRSKKRMG